MARANLLRDLDDARMTHWKWILTHFEAVGAAPKYAAAFAAYGLEVTPGRIEELARRIHAEQPAIREALIVALEEWHATALEARKLELASLVEAIATAADDDPWRQQFRVAVIASDATALRGLSGQARRLALPPSAVLLLALHLFRSGDRDEALALLRWARSRHVADFWIHYELGRGLAVVKDQSPLIVEETIGCYRTALALRPAASDVHCNLGDALQAKNQWDEAIAEYRKVIELSPKLPMAHNNLGNALRGKNRLEEAIGEYKRAIQLDPQLTMAHTNLGNAFALKNQLDEAGAEYRKAIELDPKCAMALYNLGATLKARNQLVEASARYRQVIDLQADCYAEANCNLASILQSQGQLSASLDFYKRGHAAGSNRKDWRFPSARWVANAERLVGLEAKLPDVLAGTTPADNRERLGLVEVCRLKRRHVAAARLCAAAFAADPKLAEDLKAAHRYNAACSAAMAAAGQGADADKIDDQEHTRLRQQALAWLRADLEQWAKRPEAGKPEDRQVMRDTLEHWQRDTDLASVRDAEALQKLTAPDQEAWRKLWADVAELLKKAGNAKA